MADKDPQRDRMIEQVMAQIKPAPTDGEFTGREWDVVIIGPHAPEALVTLDGREFVMSKNGLPYAVDALRESVPMWEGVKVYDNHLTDEEFQARQGMRSVAREWVGAISAPYFDAQARELKGRLRIVDLPLATKLKEAWDGGVLKSIGLSIDTYPIRGSVMHNGSQIEAAIGFEKINSLDIVAEPAAGGRFARLVASEQTHKESTMDLTKEQLEELLAGEKGAEYREMLASVLTPPEQESEKADEGEEAPVAEAEKPDEDDKEEQPEPVAEAKKAEPEQPKAKKESVSGGDVVDKLRRLECKITLREKLDAAKLSAELRRVVESAFDGRIFDEKELDAVIKRSKEAQGAADKDGRVTGAGGTRGNVQVTFDERDKQEAGFMRLIMGHTAFRALESSDNAVVKERVTEAKAYDAWVKAGRPNYGALRVSEWLRDVLKGNPLTDPRAYEAITTSGITSIIKNTVNIMVAADYSQRTEWWAPLVRTEEVETLDDATLVRLYGLSTLSVVNEGDPYTELPWADEEETASFVKHGNYVGVTMESLLQDKVNALRTLPQRLSNSWYNTLSNMVSAVFTTNTAAGPVLSDTGALFNSTAVTSAGGHANLLTAGLSFAAFGAARTAMRKQTDQVLGAGQRLMLEPRYMLVPVELESTAIQLRNTEKLPGSANNDMNPYYQAFDIVTVPNWTDANDWALVADPAQFPAIWMIFLRGNRVPSLFTADNEAGGTMFTNDTMRFKVRMMTFRYSSTYDCAPVSDFRPLHKNNVS